MAAINKLPTVGTLSTSDLVALFSGSLGNDAAATLGTLVTFLQSQLTSPGDDITQYASPNASGFGVLVSPVVDGQSVFLLLTPTAGFAAGTITLPDVSTCIDGQHVVVASTQAVTSLTVAGNGSVVNGAPTSLVANQAFVLRWDGIMQAWYPASGGTGGDSTASFAELTDAASADIPTLNAPVAAALGLKQNIAPTVITFAALAALAAANTVQPGLIYSVVGVLYIGTSISTFELLSISAPTNLVTAGAVTTQGTYVVPPDVNELDVDGSAAGAGGGGGFTSVSGGGGGGAGQHCHNKRLYVIPNETLFWQVGAGGAAGAVAGNGGVGGTTYLKRTSHAGTILLSMAGGSAGVGGTVTNGGAGGASGSIAGGATTVGAANNGSAASSGTGLVLPNEVIPGSGGGSGSVTGNGGTGGAGEAYLGGYIGGVGAGSGGGGGSGWPADDNGYTTVPGARSVGGATGVAGTQCGAPGSGGGGGGINAAGAAGADGFLRLRQIRY